LAQSFPLQVEITRFFYCSTPARPLEAIVADLKTAEDEIMRLLKEVTTQNCLAHLPLLSYASAMKTLTVRLPDVLVAEIERESQVRRVSKSDVVRERLRQPQSAARAGGSMMGLCGDLLGSVRGLPADLSSNKKKYLPGLIRASKNHRR
jgi:hypothetical protein